MYLSRQTILDRAVFSLERQLSNLYEKVRQMQPESERCLMRPQETNVQDHCAGPLFN